MAVHNRTIGRFHLEGMPPAARGIPQIEVTFDIDANGILHVSAVDKATGKEQSIKIEASSGLTDEEISKMVDDAKVHESEDKKNREEINLRNNADQLVYQTEKNIKEMESKLGDDSKAKLEAGRDRLKKALEGSDIDELKSASDDLNTIWNEVSASMYDQYKNDEASDTQDSGTESADKEPEKGEEEVEEADFEEVDPKK